MHAMPRLPLSTALLLLAAALPACAQTSLPDPIPPAVIGRPLDQIRPAHVARHKAAPEESARPRIAAVAKAPTRPAVTQMGAAAATQVAIAPATAPATTPVHGAKQALDDRYDPNAQIVDNVGQGTHFARKALGSGAYFGSRHQELVRRYYATHPAAGELAPWKIGEPVPTGARLSGVPDELRAALPPVPPGYQYVQLAGEVVMVAVPSRMVVDGVSRSQR